MRRLYSLAIILSVLLVVSCSAPPSAEEARSFTSANCRDLLGHSNKIEGVAQIKECVFVVRGNESQCYIGVRDSKGCMVYGSESSLSYGLSPGESVLGQRFKIDGYVNTLTAEKNGTRIELFVMGPGDTLWDSE